MFRTSNQYSEFELIILFYEIVKAKYPEVCKFNNNFHLSKENY